VKLGLAVGYSGAEMRLPMERIILAEKLGYDSVWTAEAYGSDAITPLAFIAAHTKRIRLGTGIMQLAGRSPTMCAMQAATVDALAGGNRVIAGLGTSGPQIVEGWYGQPWGRPYYRLKDYVQIMKKVFAREAPVTHDGKEYQLPYHGPGTMGIGKPLKSILHMNPDLPVWLGTGTETNVRLTGEVADGWLPLGFVPGSMKTYKPWVEEGFARAGNGKSWKDLEVQGSVQVNITNDVRDALRRLKPNVALYVGGMGHRDKNFHNDMMVRRGYGDAAKTIQELYLSGRKAEAIEAVPDEYLDEGALVGPVARIKERYRAWEDSGLTGLTIGTQQEEALELMAEITGASKGNRD
jgi:F420-dependent oxidoreductase-like protein